MLDLPIIGKGVKRYPKMGVEMAEVYLFNHGVDPGDIEQSLGIVCGLCVYSRNAIMDKLARFKDFIGGKIGTYEKLVRQAVEHSINDLVQQAADRGANAVVNVTIELTPTALLSEGTQICALAYGTAVRLKEGVY